MESLVTQHNLQAYYQNKKVFVTGHTGFKGAWLAVILKELGAVSKGYSLEPENDNSLFQIIKEYSNTESIINDIRNKEILEREILEFNPDFIFHLAAQSLVTKSYQTPAETFEINVVGTANLLECVTKLKKKCTVVVITTDKVYENKEQHILYNEEDTLGGYDPYSASKAATELVVSSFRNSFFNTAKFNHHQKALASARAGNVIGGGDWSSNRIIPDIIRALSENQIIAVRNPDAVRPWQHVLEPLFGYLLLGLLLDTDYSTYSKAYNFGPMPQDHLTVKEIVESAIKIWGAGQWEDTHNINQPHEANLLQLDITRAINELQWSPKLSAQDAVNWTVDWYKQPKEEQLNFTVSQIKTYLSL
ncbi:MAG: CDP-glucose 4,6-dehydratase [Chitinophagales bacterium]